MLQTKRAGLTGTDLKTIALGTASLPELQMRHD